MDRIRAPWRMSYLLSASSGPCLFCRVIAAAPDADRVNLVLCRRRRALVMLNAYPYTPGHLMVVPEAHADAPDRLSADDRGALSDALCETLARLRLAVRPDGVNLGMNLGSAGGAGIADHCHWHLVPRYVGDTNFASVVGEVRVIPEALLATYDRLLANFS